MGVSIVHCLRRCIGVLIRCHVPGAAFFWMAWCAAAVNVHWCVV